MSRQLEHLRVLDLADWFERRGPPAPRFAHGDPNIRYLHRRATIDTSAAGIPLVLRNISYGTTLYDVLFAFTITGHYRYLPQPR